jgi:hypothetical protein
MYLSDRSLHTPSLKGSLVIILLLGVAPASQAQAVARAMPAWDAGLLLPRSTWKQSWAGDPALPDVRQVSRSRSHTGTGLLVGALVGVAATTAFLIGFCDDPDTKCEIDEVGRAVVLIAVPVAAVGALIGSLIRTDE